MTFVMRTLAEIATEHLTLPKLGLSCIRFHGCETHDNERLPNACLQEPASSSLMFSEVNAERQRNDDQQTRSQAIRNCHGSTRLSD